MKLALLPTEVKTRLRTIKTTMDGPKDSKKQILTT